MRVSITNINIKKLFALNDAYRKIYLKLLWNTIEKKKILNFLNNKNQFF